jgi:hypothetical protein
VGHRSVRDEALDRLIPKILGILWERGDINSLSGVTTHLENGIEIGGYYVRPGAFGLSVGVPEDPLPPPNWRVTLKPVFSVHLDATSPGPDYRFNYQEGRCTVLGWRRGEWENHIAAQPAAPRSIDQLVAEGLSPKAPVDTMAAARKAGYAERLKEAEENLFRAIRQILDFDPNDCSPDLRAILTTHTPVSIEDLPPEIRVALGIQSKPTRH